MDCDFENTNLTFESILSIKEEYQRRIKEIAIQELFNPMLNIVDVGDDSELISDLRDNYYRTIHNLFRLYSTSHINGESYAARFSCKSQWSFFNDMTMELSNDIYYKEGEKYDEATGKLNSLSEKYWKNVPEDKRVDYFGFESCTGELLKRNFFEKSERKKVYDLMRKVIHTLVFKRGEILDDLTEEPKAIFSTKAGFDELYRPVLEATKLSDDLEDGDVALYLGNVLFGNSNLNVSKSEQRLEDIYDVPESPRRYYTTNQKDKLVLQEIQGVDSVDQAMNIFEARCREYTNE